MNAASKGGFPDKATDHHALEAECHTSTDLRQEWPQHGGRIICDGRRGGLEVPGSRSAVRMLKDDG